MEKEFLAAGLSSIFEHREAHIVIALTGRTGSGCSTLAKTLATSDFGSISLPPIANIPKTQEERKSQIVRDWLSEKWGAFLKINVSDIIFLTVLAEDSAKIIDHINAIVSAIDTVSLCDILSRNHCAAKKVISILNDIKSADDAQLQYCHDYVFRELHAISVEFRSILSRNSRQDYTEVFQSFGNNLRRSGSPISDHINPLSLLTLPETILLILKINRVLCRKQNSQKTYTVIDALRHPFEVRYLRERLPRFYLVAVTTEDGDRKTRLNALNYKDSEILKLDNKEYPSQTKREDRQKGYSAFVSQDIQACLALSDIYISNLGSGSIGSGSNSGLRNATEQLVRYVALMQHPGLVTPTSIERCMQAAFSAKVNSGCISRQVGAVVTDASFAIKAMGWNDVPKGQVPCLLRNLGNLEKSFDEIAYSQYELTDEGFRTAAKAMAVSLSTNKLQGRNRCYCFKDIYNSINSTDNQVHTRSLHAEENAFLQIAKHGGQGIEGGNLFSTASPCELCAKKAFQLGIKNIYYIDPYPGISRNHVLASGHNKPNISLFSGAIGRSYHDLYEPILSYKDELSKLAGA